MVLSSKYIFGALLGVFRTSASRRLAATLTSIALMGMLPAFPSTSPTHVQLTPTLTAGGSWLNRFNAWRASSGVPTLSENLTWSDGDYKHSLYMVKNDEVAHQEISTHPYYTPEGDAAARNSNIYVSSTTSTADESAIDWWMQAPFHAMGMMDPRLTSTGFGSYREVKAGWQMGAAVDTIRGNSFTGGQYPVYFPGNGSTEPLRTFGGFETPDPLQACPGYAAPTGLPVFVEIGGNVSTTVGPVHTITGNGASLENCAIDSTNPTLGSSLRSRGGVILIPRQPLQNGVTYVVALTVNGLPYTWSFTVGAGPTATPPPSPPTPFKTLYTLDGWGGIHGDDSPPLAVSGYWPGWKIARAAKSLPSATQAQSGLVLDGWGGLHSFGTPTVSESSPGHYWPYWDIARDFAFLPDGSGGFVLDGWGGLHPFRVNGNTAPLQAQGFAYWPYWDIARKVVIFPDGTGGYTMDAWGGVHQFGINGPSPVGNVAMSAYWPNWSIARDIVLVPGNGNHSGYVLDGWGGLHPFHPTTDGSAMPGSIAVSGYWPWWDIARGLFFLPGSATAGYTLDGWGGLHPFGTAAPIKSSSYWPYWDIAQGIFGA